MVQGERPLHSHHLLEGMLQLLSVTAGIPDVPNNLLWRVAKALGAWSSFLWGELGKGYMDGHGYLGQGAVLPGTPAATSELQSTLAQSLSAGNAFRTCTGT